MAKVWLIVFVAAVSFGQPETRVEERREVLHGVELNDPYAWLDDFRGGEAREWLRAQNGYAEKVLAGYAGREEIKKRLLAWTRYDSISAPEEAGGRYFFEKRRAAGGRALLCMRVGVGGKDEVLIDPDSVSKESSTGVDYYAFSKDGKLVAYSVRAGGRDEVEIRFFDVEARRDLAERLPVGLYSGVTFARDGKGFYYVRRSRETGSRVMWHGLGTGVESDRDVFGRAIGRDQFANASLSPDGKFLLVSVQHGWTKSELFLVDLVRGGEARELTAGITAQFSRAWCGPSCLLVSTTWEAGNRRLMRIDLENPDRGSWKTVVPESGESLQGFAVVGGVIHAAYLKNVAGEVRRYTLEGKRLANLRMAGMGTARVSGDWDRDEGVLVHSTFTEPTATYLLHGKTGEKKEWFRARIGVDAGAYVTAQVWYKSKDGTRVPMFLVYKKGLKKDGGRPVLLNGYGGFNVAQTPGFRAAALLMAEMGGVYALANIRGGSEFGEAWHKAGMLGNKQNVFDDFIGAAEWLIANRYTRPEKLGITGASNGGLLVGAALTQRPELFRAVLCGYPDLDMIRYYRYKENHNPPALLEYGDASKPEEFAFLRKYSPYEHVRKGTRYPAVLITTGDGDTRVPPQQGMKFAAKLQSATVSGRPVLLRFQFNTGHAGGRSIDEAMEAVAAEYAFLLGELGVRPGQ